MKLLFDLVPFQDAAVCTLPGTSERACCERGGQTATVAMLMLSTFRKGSGLCSTADGAECEHAATAVVLFVCRKRQCYQQHQAAAAETDEHRSLELSNLASCCVHVHHWACTSASAAAADDADAHLCRFHATALQIFCASPPCRHMQRP